MSAQWRPGWGFLSLGWEAGCRLGGLGMGTAWRRKGCTLGLWVVREPGSRLGLARSQVCLGCQLLLASLFSFFSREMSSFSAVKGWGVWAVQGSGRSVLLPWPLS